MDQNIPYLDIPTLMIDIQKRVEKEGTVYLKSAIELEAYPKRTTMRLRHWANQAPDKTFLAQRDANGSWEALSYRETYDKIQKIGQYLIASGASAERPIAILSENSLEHGLIALAALHVGIPYSPISPAYSLKSSDFGKLKHCIDLLTPGLVFVQDGKQYEKALQNCTKSIPTISVTNSISDTVPFENLLNTTVTPEVEKAYQNIGSETIAKILFTSGSTGMPKGVINTHGNLTANLQQITQTFPFMAGGGLTLIDWLPWNHTFGGNHNFGLTHYNGGSLYIDEGNPTPTGFMNTITNLKEIAPTVYFNVPKGFEQLVSHLKKDKELCRHFFSRLKMLFYAGASMPQHVWDGLEELSYKTTGKLLLISSGLGMTEASPSAMFNTKTGHESGRLGVPVPGLEVKLVPIADTFEARFKGPNLTPGYWRNPEQTEKAFDEEGYYKTGDALKFIDPTDPNAGMIFDGRIAENFKLSSGTWVNVGLLKSKLIAAGKGLIKEVVLTGHDKDFIGAIVFPDLEHCSQFLNENKNEANILESEPVRQTLQHILNTLGRQGTGSSTIIKRAVMADFEPSLQWGELTDKGSINQRAVLTNRKSTVQKLYAKQPESSVIEFKPTKD